MAAFMRARRWERVIPIAEADGGGAPMLGTVAARATSLRRVPPTAHKDRPARKVPLDSL